MGDRLNKVTDFGYMYWAKGWRSPEKVLHFYTSSYGAAFDVLSGGLTRLGAFKQPRNAHIALHARASDIHALPVCNLAWQVSLGRQDYLLTGCCGNISDVSFYQNGRYLNRAELANCVFTSQDGTKLPIVSRMLISALPDFLSINLELYPKKEISAAILSVQFTLGEKVVMYKQAGSCLYLEYINGAGIMVSPTEAQDITYKDGVVTITQPHLSVQANNVLRLGIKLMPKAGMKSFSPSDRVFTAPPLAFCIEAKGIFPYKDFLDTAFDKANSIYLINLPQKQSDEPERVCIRVENPYNEPIKLPIQLSKPVQIMGVPVLVDQEGNPLPVVVQTSCDRIVKGKEINYMDCVFIAHLSANQVVTFEFLVFYSMVGDTYAAKLYNLLMRKNLLRTLLQEASLGAEGASYNFDIDNGQLSSIMNNIYPLALEHNEERINRLSGAPLWGCDLLVLYNEEGERVNFSSGRCLIENSGPVAGIAHYACQSDDGCLEAHITQTLTPSDDYLRAYLNVRIDVLKRVSYSRAVLFSLGADRNNSIPVQTFAYGDVYGLISELTVDGGGQCYRIKAQPASDKSPWFYLQSSQSNWSANVNRGFVVRRYRAVCGGEAFDTPYFALFGTEDKTPSAAVELVLPPAVQLLPGDYVEFVAESVALPVSAEEYSGQNENFYDALSRSGCGWKLMHREVVGNNLIITASRGEVLSVHPITILAQNDGAEFEISGGLGYQPVIISGIKSIAGRRLQVLKDGAGADIKTAENLAYTLHYEEDTNTYAMVFAFGFDDITDGRGKRFFRLI